MCLVSFLFKIGFSSLYTLLQACWLGLGETKMGGCWKLSEMRREVNNETDIFFIFKLHLKRRGAGHRTCTRTYRIISYYVQYLVKYLLVKVILNHINIHLRRTMLLQRDPRQRKTISNKKHSPPVCFLPTKPRPPHPRRVKFECS